MSDTNQSFILGTKMGKRRRFKTCSESGLGLSVELTLSCEADSNRTSVDKLI